MIDDKYMPEILERWLERLCISFARTMAGTIFPQSLIWCGFQAKDFWNDAWNVPVIRSQHIYMLERWNGWNKNGELNHE